MTTQMTDREAQIEREQVEWVFGLTGGELNAGPTPYTYQAEGYDITDHTYKMMTKSGHFAYTYDGVPDYAGHSEFPDVYDNHVDYFTAVTDCLYGGPPDTITVAGKVYTKVREWSNSGETECCYSQGDDGPNVTEEQAVKSDYSDRRYCPYCEADEGEEHGCIYLGDGWYEVVYRHDGIQAMRDCAEAHNINVWMSDAVDAACSDPECGNTETHEHEFYYACAENQECGECGGATESQGAKPKWWWQTCSPGCLPDSDIMGPFDDEVEALEDATSDLMD